MLKKNVFIIIFLPLISVAQIDPDQQLTHTISDSSLANSLNTYALSYLNEDNNKTLNYSKQAYQISKEINYNKGMAIANQMIGYFYQKRYQYDSAKIYFHRALNLFRKTNMFDNNVNTLKALANVYFLDNNYTFSIKYSLDALDMINKEGFNKNTIDIYSNIGRSYYQLGSYTESIQYYTQAIQLARKESNNELIAKILNRIAYSYVKLDKKEKALKYHKKALIIAQQLKNEYSVAVYTSSIGDLYSDINNCDSALNYILPALQIFKKLNYEQGYAWTLMSSAKCYNKLNNSQLAEKNALLSIDIAKKINNLNIELLANQILYQIFHKKKQYKKALEHFERSKYLKDSIYSQKVYNQFSKIQTQHAIEKEVREKDMLKSRLVLQYQQYEFKKFQIRILIFLIILIFIILFVIWMYYRQKTKTLENENKIIEQQKSLQEKDAKIQLAKQKLTESELKTQMLEKAKLNEELAYKNKEITNLAIHITQKNEMLEKIKEELRKVRNSSNSRDINKLYSVLNQTSQLDVDREKFQMFVNEQNDAFFLNLDKNFPNLTQSEKKLLALLKMNLSSKEIAGVFNISPASVNTKRYRLRKKLNIDSDESLIQFLRKI